MTIHRPTLVRSSAAASLLTLAAITLTGCSSAKTTKPVAAAMPAQPESDDYAGLTRGQTFSVRLPTYCGSQRAWRLAPESAEDRFVKLVDRKSQQVEPGESDILDSRSWDVFTFRASKVGETQIEFIYDQPWMPEQAAIRTHVMTCSVAAPVKGQGKLQMARVTVD